MNNNSSIDRPKTQINYNVLRALSEIDSGIAKTETTIAMRQRVIKGFESFSIINCLTHAKIVNWGK